MKQIALALALLATLAVSAQNKRYITQVYDFKPAPGQFVNVIPKAQAGDSKETVLERVAQALCGYEDSQGEVIADGMISLGSYGGYVIFGFDHPLVNVVGEYDLQIFGNASVTQTSPDYGSSEPGIVMVANDLNGPWYELAGSEYNNPRTQHDFKITYYKPDPDKTATPDASISATDTTYVRWTCNSVDSLTTGYVNKNSWHTQSYWPEWLDDDTMTFEGAKLRCNAQDISGSGSMWVQYNFGWGYVDNRPDFKYDGSTPTETQNQGFNLDWAMDSEGNHVTLKSVKYIKVYNATLQQCGWIGEISTEVAGAIDLHPDAVAQETVTGDVNGDGQVDITDVNLIINAILAGSDNTTCDINADGEVDITDVNLAINAILVAE